MGSALRSRELYAILTVYTSTAVLRTRVQDTLDANIAFLAVYTATCITYDTILNICAIHMDIFLFRSHRNIFGINLGLCYQEVGFVCSSKVVTTNY